MSGETPESGEGPTPTSPPTTVQVPSGETDDGAPHASGPVHAHHPAVQFRFLEQLKHRNIIRVGILYLVACWLILDPVHVVFHMLEVPAWANRLVVILMVIGFPVILLFAWVYEITPEGLKPTVEVDPHRSIRKLTGQRLDRAIMVVLVLGIAYLLVDKFWLSKHTTNEQPVAAVTPGATPAAPAIPGKSVAVLPFVDMSEKKDQEYFSDGLSEELIDLLTKIPGLRVPARTSSFYFKGKQTTIGEIGKELSVAHILERSVRKSGNPLRVTAQLIRVDNGYHVWSQTFDRKLDDVFKVQDEIAAAVVQTLKVTLLTRPVAQPARAPNTAAYTSYLQGRFFAAHNSRDGNARAVPLFEQAVRDDSTYALGWAGLARVVARSADNGWVPLASGYDRARAAAAKALQLDSNLVEGHAIMAYIKSTYD
jgi:TolB-like protein